MTVKIILDAVTNLTWALKLIPAGAKYGLGDKLVNSASEPIVEFYDTRFPHTPLGQFVSPYYASTLLAIPEGQGLNLSGDVPSWTVSAQVISAVKDWLNTVQAAPAVMSADELLLAMRRAVKTLAIAKGGLRLNMSYADGNWRVLVHEDGKEVEYEGYAKEERGATGTLDELDAGELVGLLYQ